MDFALPRKEIIIVLQCNTSAIWAAMCKVDPYACTAHHGGLGGREEMHPVRSVR